MAQIPQCSHVLGILCFSCFCPFLPSRVCDHHPHIEPYPLQRCKLVLLSSCPSFSKSFSIYSEGTLLCLNSQEISQFSEEEKKPSYFLHMVPIPFFKICIEHPHVL